MVPIAKPASFHGASRNRVKAGTSKGAAQLKRTMFAEEFTRNGGNATRAAIAVGYAPHSAAVTGSRLLRDVHVRTAVRMAEERALEKSRLTTRRVLQEVERVAFMDPRKLYDASGRLKPIRLLDPDTAAAIASLDIDEMTTGRGPSRRTIGTTAKVRLHDKLGALDRAMRYLGLYERHNRQRDESLSIQINLVAAPPRPKIIDNG